jgi:hypothetical protein
LWSSCSAAVAAWRRGPDAIDGFALGYAGLLAIYFTHHPRLTLPLLAIVYRAALESIELMACWSTVTLPDPPRRRLTAIATGLAVAALFAVDLAELPTRLDVESQRLPSGEQGAVWQDLETAAAWLSVQTDPSARVLAGPAPILSLLSGRDVYTYRFARRPGLIDRYQVRYGVLFPGTPVCFAPERRGGLQWAPQERPARD